MALALGELLRAVSLGAQSERRADFLSHASLDGASQLAEIGVSLPLAAGESAGRYGDGLLWRLGVAQDRAAVGLDGRAVLVGYRLRLQVLPAAGRAPGLTLIAEKLAAPRPAGGAP